VNEPVAVSGKFIVIKMKLDILIVNSIHCIDAENLGIRSRRGVKFGLRGTKVLDLFFDPFSSLNTQRTL
jgi:hypothetical protein